MVSHHGTLDSRAMNYIPCPFTPHTFLITYLTSYFIDRPPVIHFVHSCLQEVYFPTVIVCNINQIKKSLFSSLRKSAALADVETGEIEDLLYQQERRIHVQKQWVFNSVRNQC